MDKNSHDKYFRPLASDGINQVSMPSANWKDPLKQRSWSLGMTVAWIASREVSEVNASSAAYRDGKAELARFAAVAEGRRIPPRREYPVDLLSCLDRAKSRKPPSHLDQLRAWDELHKSLESGRLSSVGVSPFTFQATKIDPSEFTRLRITMVKRGRTIVDGLVDDESDTEVYFSISVSSDEVLVLWPSREAPKSTRGRPETFPSEVIIAEAQDGLVKNGFPHFRRPRRAILDDLANWASDRFSDAPPSDSLLNKHLRTAIARLKDRGATD